MPATANSQTVEAPARPITRWAAAQPAGHVAEEGRDLGVDHGVAIDAPRGLHGFRPGLLLHHQPLAQGLRQGGDGRGHQFGEQARALAAAGDQEADRPSAGRDVGQVGQGADLRAHRIADHHGARPAPRAAPSCRVGKAQATRVTRGGQEAVGPAHHRVLLVDHGRAAGR